uniref:Cytochrome b5-like n=1 Tax=Petromyzon marinus TaxID=7757 RepID=A0AAJ7U637_PETMA|nr:cytochrome b5-like [Petromyzon marinus]
MAVAGESLMRMEEVKQRAAAGRLCLVIHGKVYDVSDFAAEHPGGESVLLEKSGKDATEAFEDAGHSGDAREMMQQYYIGELDTEGSTLERPQAKKIPGCSSPTSARCCCWLWLAPAVAVGLVVAWRYYRRA